MCHKQYALLMGVYYCGAVTEKKDETFEVIFQRYSQFLTHLGIDTIVFNGYALSTKDTTHQKRAGKMSQQ